MLFILTGEHKILYLYYIFRMRFVNKKRKEKAKKFNG